MRRCLLVRTGYGAAVEARRKAEIERALVFDDLNAAADWVIGQDKPGGDKDRERDHP